MRLPFSRLALASLVLLSTLVPPPSLLASDWPTITEIPPTADEGIAFDLEGLNFDADSQLVVIRARNEDGGASSGLDQISTSLMRVTLDPVGEDFVGDLELHVVEYYELPDDLLISGPRQYYLDDILWIKSLCYVHGGEIYVNPPVPGGDASVSELLLPDFQLMRDPITAMDGTIVLASGPPPSCDSLDLALGSGAGEGGTAGFFATLAISQFEGPTPTQEQWNDDLALAIQQSFSAQGLFAGPHPDGLVIGSSSGLAGGFALLFERGPEP